MRLFQWRTETVYEGEQKESFLLRPEFRPKQKQKKASVPFVDRFCLLWWVFSLAIRYWGKPALIIKEEEIKFTITDFENELNISFSGTVPNLFSEEKGVVAEGKLQDKTFFIADRILAKHDENYMPPELKDMMKKNAK